MNPREKWRLLAEGWMSLTPPAAPSKGDIALYIGAGRVTSSSNVLLLGCTPALRQALARHGAAFATVDFTPEMLSKSLSIFPAAPAEVVANADWLDLPFASNHFDCVLGDKVIGNVMPNDWPTWFANLHRVTREDAVIVTRITLSALQESPSDDSRTFGDRVDYWSDLVSRGVMSVEHAVSGLWEECMTASVEWLDEGVGTQVLARATPGSLEHLIDDRQTPTVQVEVLEAFRKRFWPSRNAKWSAYTLDGIRRTAEPWFEVSDVLHSEDYIEAANQPLLVLSRRDTRTLTVEVSGKS
jgi:hypothetical protein